MIFTGFPDDAGDSVTVIGISRFCPTVPPVIVIVRTVARTPPEERWLSSTRWSTPSGVSEWSNP